MGRGRSAATLNLRDEAVAILEEIQPATVRAVCYRLFIAGYLDSMRKSETNRVSHILTRAREHDEFDWTWVVDETRQAESIPTWADPEEFLNSALQQYRKDAWRLQPRRIEVWSEKGTVRGTLAPVLDEYGVTFRVLHGYASFTAVKVAAEQCAADDRPWVVFYVGDWDPSGMHMSEVDLPRRLDEYLGDAAGRLTLRRIGLSPADVRDPELPWFHAATKRTDTRWAWYRTHYGDRCWELDALSPVVLRTRVEHAIQTEIEPATWARCLEVQTVERASLAAFLRAWGQGKSRQAQEYDADGHPGPEETPA